MLRASTPSLDVVALDYLLMTFDPEGEGDGGDGFEPNDRLTAWTTRRRKERAGAVLAGVTVCGVVGAVVIAFLSFAGGGGHHSSGGGGGGESAFAVALEVTNSYTEALGPIGASYPWAATRAASGEGEEEGVLVIDAHRKCSLHLIHATPGCPVAWTIDAVPSGEGGSVLETSFRSIGLHVVEAEERCSGAAPRRAAAQVAALRVRRELRDLFSADRRAFIHAMATMYNLSTAEGQRVFGKTVRGSAVVLEPCGGWALFAF